MIDRTSESAAQKIAHELGLDDTFIHEDPRGWKISRFVSNAATSIRATMRRWPER